MILKLSEQRLAAAKIAAAKRNSDNPDTPPWTPEQWCENELGTSLDSVYATKINDLKSMMAPVADEIIAACGGDEEKIASALNAGRKAALKTI